MRRPPGSVIHTIDARHELQRTRGADGGIENVTIRCFVAPLGAALGAGGDGDRQNDPTSSAVHPRSERPHVGHGSELTLPIRR